MISIAIDAGLAERFYWQESSLFSKCAKRGLALRIGTVGIKCG